MSKILFAFLSVLTLTLLKTAAHDAVSTEKLKVLFVGDSIVGSSAENFIGYAHPITTLKPEWDISRVGVNTTENLLKRLRNSPDVFIGYDIIYINSGLHSLRRDRFEDLDTFEANIADIMRLLAQLQDTCVIWRTTTPIAERASGGRDGSLVPVYNAVAIKHAEKNGIHVDDLYAFLMPYFTTDSARGGKYLVPDGTHWRTQAQQEIIAPHIIEVIQQYSDKP